MHQPPTKSQNKRVMVAMSGGVDSAMTALLAIDQHGSANVFGMTARVCDAVDGANDAQQVCEALGIRHYAVDLREKFDKLVIEPFANSYAVGKTPNPCVTCNQAIKFGALLDAALELDCDIIATGHYAKTWFDEKSQRYQIGRAKDRSKDQSYFLAQLSQELLSRAAFPLGDLTKEEVRAMAADAKLPVASKPESQDICFIPDGDYASIVEARLGMPDKGPIEDVTGRIIGQHSGLIHYTIGQRKGIGIGGGKPLYVLDKNADRNALIVGDHDELLTQNAKGSEVNFIGIAPDEASEDMRAMIKTSYRQTLQPAEVAFAGNIVTLKTDAPIVRPAPGQTIAIYDSAGDRLIAGAVVA